MDLNGFQDTLKMLERTGCYGTMRKDGFVYAVQSGMCNPYVDVRIHECSPGDGIDIDRLRTNIAQTGFKVVACIQTTDVHGLLATLKDWLSKSGHQGANIDTVKQAFRGMQDVKLTNGKSAYEVFGISRIVICK